MKGNPLLYSVLSYPVLIPEIIQSFMQEELNFIIFLIPVKIIHFFRILDKIIEFPLINIEIEMN